MTPTPKRVLGLHAALVIVSFLVAGCTSPTRRPTVVSAPAVDRTYVALGALDDGSAVDPTRADQWTQRFFRDSLPLGTVLFDLRTSGASVQSTIDRQLREALRLEPDIVTIWLDASDPIRGLAVDEYRRLLAQLVEPLRRGGKTSVLVANVPPFDPQLRATVATYNVAIADVLREQTAVLVDLHAAAGLSADSRTLVVVPGSGFGTIDHAKVAAAFAEALPSDALRGE